MAIDGTPRSGEEYGIYLDGFAPDENVALTVADFDLGSQLADSAGGVWITVPLGDRGSASDVLLASGTGAVSGKTSTFSFRTAPSKKNSGVWATSGSQTSITLDGSNTKIDNAHTDGGINVAGQNVAISNLEYGTTLKASGTSFVVTSKAVVPPNGNPYPVLIDDWKPGGRKAIEVGALYKSVAAASCTNGQWNVSAVTLSAGGIYYVPCRVRLTGNNTTVTATIIAEGAIVVAGNGITLTPPAGSDALVSASTSDMAINLAGNTTAVNGRILAVGGVRVDGNNAVLRCTVAGRQVAIAGNNTVVPRGTCPTAA